MCNQNSRLVVDLINFFIRKFYVTYLTWYIKDELTADSCYKYDSSPFDRIFIDHC